jgi:hypothetical protein
VIPIYEVSLTLFGILNGEMFFKDMEGFSSRQWTFFSLGLVLNLAGVLLISMYRKKSARQIPSSSEAYEKQSSTIPA